MSLVESVFIVTWNRYVVLVSQMTLPSNPSLGLYLISAPLWQAIRTVFTPPVSRLKGLISAVNSGSPMQQELAQPEYKHGSATRSSELPQGPGKSVYVEDCRAYKQDTGVQTQTEHSIIIMTDYVIYEYIINGQYLNLVDIS